MQATDRVDYSNLPTNNQLLLILQLIFIRTSFPYQFRVCACARARAFFNANHSPPRPSVATNEWIIRSTRRIPETAGIRPYRICILLKNKLLHYNNENVSNDTDGARNRAVATDAEPSAKSFTRSIATPGVGNKTTLIVIKAGK